MANSRTVWSACIIDTSSTSSTWDFPRNNLWWVHQEEETGRGGSRTETKKHRCCLPGYPPFFFFKGYCINSPTSVESRWACLKVGRLWRFLLLNISLCVTDNKSLSVASFPPSFSSSTSGEDHPQKNARRHRHAFTLRLWLPESGVLTRWPAWVLDARSCNDKECESLGVSGICLVTF